MAFIYVYKQWERFMETVLGKDLRGCNTMARCARLCCAQLCAPAIGVVSTKNLITKIRNALSILAAAALRSD